ncbi:hypothetical protein NDU88_007570 [Pleurodeles waltl]|uniref:Uncharacterized protein n=1 Tax=Pleurodeles waltl TaxID=8319 RepID=A0AAV7NV81_PLEWA|nr:hypothetical protein NDU88_007570 [Pleurodeles waltl]
MPHRFSAWAPAQLSPSQLAADPRYAAHLTQESRGGLAAGDTLVAALSLPGRIPEDPFLGAAQTPGAPLAGRGSAASSIHRSPRSKAQRRLLLSLHSTPAPRQSHQGAGSSESVSPRRPGSDVHFDTWAAARIRGSASMPLTTSGPGRDGEIAGTAGTAPLGL